MAAALPPHMQKHTPPPSLPIQVNPDPRRPTRRGSVVSQRLRTLSAGASDNGPRLERLGSVMAREKVKMSRNASVLFDRVDGRKIIEAGTRAKLLDVLLDLELDPEFAMDSDFAPDFILTYEYFMTPTELLHILAEYYFPDIPPDLAGMARKLFLRGIRVTRERIVHVLEVWVATDVEDFWYTPHLYQTLMAFIDDAVADTQEPHMLDALFRVSRAVVAAEATSGLVETPLADLRAAIAKTPKPNRLHSSFVLLDIDVDHLARQITLLDHAYYRSVKPTECLWLGKDMELGELYGPSPNLAAWMERSYAWADWVWSSILCAPSNSARARTIEYFIDLAAACLDLSNFNSACWIVSGLFDNAVAANRLKSVWAKVKDSARQVAESIKADFLHNGFVFYKDNMEAKAEPPLVALMAAYKKWFVSLDMSNKNETASGLINFDKLRAIGSTIRRFDSAQSEEYLFEPDLAIMYHLVNIDKHTISIQDAWARSLEIEPWKGKRAPPPPPPSRGSGF